MIAILRPGGQQKGSRPTPPRLKDVPGWLLLSARKGLNGKVLYVRGHLLHDYPGGAGIDFNEAILTAAIRGDFGANHANWVHRYLVEGQLVANQQLWQFEDQNIPKALLIRYSWIENGVLKGPYSETVSIVLPNSLAATFKM